jgi:hypothetical protein
MRRRRPAETGGEGGWIGGPDEQAGLFADGQVRYVNAAFVQLLCHGKRDMNVEIEADHE